MTDADVVPLIMYGVAAAAALAVFCVIPATYLNPDWSPAQGLLLPVIPMVVLYGLGLWWAVLALGLWAAFWFVNGVVCRTPFADRMERLIRGAHAVNGRRPAARCVSRSVKTIVMEAMAYVVVIFCAIASGLMSSPLFPLILGSGIAILTGVSILARRVDRRSH